jgi:hypothetical protein
MEKSYLTKEKLIFVEKTLFKNKDFALQFP